MVSDLVCTCNVFFCFVCVCVGIGCFFVCVHFPYIYLVILYVLVVSFYFFFFFFFLFSVRLFMCLVLYIWLYYVAQSVDVILKGSCVTLAQRYSIKANKSREKEKHYNQARQIILPLSMHSVLPWCKDMYVYFCIFSARTSLNLNDTDSTEGLMLGHTANTRRMNFEL